MRALGYFTFDPGARKGSLAYQSRYLAFRRFCERNRHADSRAFADPIGQEGAGGWREMIDFIRDGELAYLVVVPNAQVLGASLEDQVERVLEADALNSRVVCADLNYPDPLQNALRGASGRRERVRQGCWPKPPRVAGSAGRPSAIASSSMATSKSCPKRPRSFASSSTSTSNAAEASASWRPNSTGADFAPAPGNNGAWSPFATSSAIRPISAPTVASVFAFRAVMSPLSVPNCSERCRSA